MKHLQQILTGFAQQDSVLHLSAYLAQLAAQLHYRSCAVHFRHATDQPSQVAALGLFSAELRQFLAKHQEQFWRNLPQAGIAVWICTTPSLLSVRIRQPQAAAIFIEPQPQTNAEQSAALALFWQLLAPALELQLAGFGDAAPNCTLTVRERECVQWAAAYKTSWEISRILGISERTVHFHIQNCLKKVGVENRIQLINFCRLWGFIDG